MMRITQNSSPSPKPPEYPRILLKIYHTLLGERISRGDFISKIRDVRDSYQTLMRLNPGGSGWEGKLALIYDEILHKAEHFDPSGGQMPSKYNLEEFASFDTMLYDDVVDILLDLNKAQLGPKWQDALRAFRGIVENVIGSEANPSCERVALIGLMDYLLGEPEAADEYELQVALETKYLPAHHIPGCILRLGIHNTGISEAKGVMLKSRLENAEELELRCLTSERISTILPNTKIPVEYLVTAPQMAGQEHQCKLTVFLEVAEIKYPPEVFEVTLYLQEFKQLANVYEQCFDENVPQQSVEGLLGLSGGVFGNEIARIMNEQGTHRAPVLHFDQKVIDQLSQFAATQPKWALWVCFELVELCNEQENRWLYVAAPEMQQAINKCIMANKDKIKEDFVLKVQGEDQQYTLAALDRVLREQLPGPAGATLGQIAARLRKRDKQFSLLPIINELCDEGLIVERDNRYSFAAGFFQDVVLHEYGMLME